MKIRVLEVALLAASLTSCTIKDSKKNISAEEIISNSINFHDPKSSWNSFKATMHFESSFSFNDSIPEDLELSFDNSEAYFNYLNHDRKVNLKYYPDTCIKLTENGDCNGYSWTYGFYPYIWGLPMKLKDPGIKPQKDFCKTVFNNNSVWEVKVHYEAENYWFYFSPSDFQLKGFKFIKNNNPNKGEIVILKGLKEFKGIQFPKHRTWLHLDSSLIGTNEFLH